MKGKISLHLILTCLFYAQLIDQAVARVQIVSIAVSGQPAPDTDQLFHSMFNAVGAPSMNDVGQITFTAYLDGPSPSVLGLWLYSGGDLSLQLLQGQTLVDGTKLLARTSPGEFRSSHITDSGLIRAGVLSNVGDGQFRLLSPFHSPPSPLPNHTSFNNLNAGDVPISFNDSGKIAFQALLAGNPLFAFNNKDSIWTDANGSLAMLALQGSAAVGGQPDSVYLNFNAGPTLNNLGQTAFSTQRFGYDPTIISQSGVWIGDAVSIRPVALGGQAAPGTSSGTLFRNTGSDFGMPRINNHSQTAFIAFLDLGAGDVTEDNDSGIWLDDAGALELVVRKGSPTPGLTDTNFHLIGESILNDAGQVAFTSMLNSSGVQRDSVWLSHAGNLSLLAKAGDHAPGTPTDTEFLDFRQLNLNSNGQVLFEALLKSEVAGINSSNDHGIWALDPAGKLTLIAREGDQLDVDRGPGIDSRTIAELSFVGTTGNAEGRPSSFNNRGQLAFTARFTDGTSGVFLSNVTAISEPATAILIAVISLTFSISRSRKRCCQN